MRNVDILATAVSRWASRTLGSVLPRVMEGGGGMIGRLWEYMTARSGAAPGRTLWDEVGFLFPGLIEAPVKARLTQMIELAGVPDDELPAWAGRVLSDLRAKTREQGGTLRMFGLDWTEKSWDLLEEEYRRCAALPEKATDGRK